MVEKSVERRDEDRSQAWWVQKCIKTEDFSIVEDSSLDPKRKLYVTYGVIINHLVLSGLLARVNSDHLNEAPFSNRVFISQEALARGITQSPSHIQAALKYAENHVYDGIIKEGLFEKEENSSAALSMSAGAETLPAELRDIRQLALGAKNWSVEDLKKDLLIIYPSVLMPVFIAGKKIL